jgi:hypothetical protein
VKGLFRFGAVIAFVLVAVGAWFSALAVTAVLYLVDRFEEDRMERAEDLADIEFARTHRIGEEWRP